MAQSRTTKSLKNAEVSVVYYALNLLVGSCSLIHCSILRLLILFMRGAILMNNIRFPSVAEKDLAELGKYSMPM